MTTTPTVWLDEFVSNLITADAQSAPRVISLTNGNFLVVWVDDNQTAADGFGTDIVGVIFDPLGNPISDSLYLNFPFGFSREEDQPDIAATPDGGFVVVYRFPTGNDTDILFGRYDAEGTRTAQDFVISDSSDAKIYTNPSVAAADDGSFFVTYEYTDGAVNDIRGVFVSAANVVGTEQILRADGFSNGSNLEDTEDPHTVLLTNGNFATVYSENDNNGGVNERTIEVRISNADGSNSTLINNVTAPDALPDSDARIAALADGRFVVMWREGGNHNGRIYNNDGSESVAEFTISNNASLNFDGAEIIGLEDSSFVVALIDETQGRLFVIRYNDDTPDGGSRIVSTDAAGTGGNITNLSMDLTGDGRILLSWQNGEIYTEILDPRDAGAFSVETDDGVTTDRQGQSTTITGTTDQDTIYGLDGNDTLIGGGANDYLDGGTGNDTLDGGEGVDIASYRFANGSISVNLNNIAGSSFADQGADTYISIEGVEGTEFGDSLQGNFMDNIFLGGAGVDMIFGGGGADRLEGGDDDDQLLGQTGDDILFGQDGNDSLNGGSGADELFGGLGDDVYFVDNGGDAVTEMAGQGNDTVSATINYVLPSEIETLRLRGNVALEGVGNDLDNMIFAGVGPATLSGLDGNDTIFGSAAADTLDGGNDNDIIFGRFGNDIINGGEGMDTLRGQGNSDTLNGGNGNDLLFGDDGQDTLNGGEGNDGLQGGALNDILNGDDGVDALLGQAGNDTLDGGAGFDTIIGGSGRDFLTGGADADKFIFDDGDYSGTSAVNSDRIFDFSQMQGDTIDVSRTDAITGGGDDVFTFIGTDSFSGTAGELRYEQGGAFTLVSGDTDGDGNADFAIRLDGLVALQAGDFIL